TRSLTVAGGGPLTGTVRVPGDKSVSHRALLLAALARGRSEVRGLSDGDDVARTAAAVAALGARVDLPVVEGFTQPRTPGAPIDAGNSGTTMRLLCGLLAPYDLRATITGDASLTQRPMDRVATPLRAMGAHVEGTGERCLPPLEVRGGSLQGIDYTPPVASAQVKGCVLLAGLGAEGETVVREPAPTRRHTEEMLARCGARIAVTADGDGLVVRLQASTLEPFALDVPGDPSQAAFWVVAATLVTGSDVVVEGIYAGPQRRGYLDVLTRMGAALTEVPSSGDDTVRDVHVRSTTLRATDVASSEITGLDEVPVLAVAAAHAEGTTVFRDVGELRVKESDRLAGVTALVRAFGGEAEVDGDDLHVTGVARLRPARVDAAGDHRMAMAAAVAGLAATDATGDGDTVVDGFEAVATSYPAFEADLRRLTGSAHHQVGA
ncbi:MAG TPA: 3-phosphoshikimate 1-carboxyvinyltransferase, partial [Acidimicrobiales bacterium]|nr:3-phosphoshikimate 1-carboxyvinyltransferase [Acidimicrobiales bacterium]